MPERPAPATAPAAGASRPSVRLPGGLGLPLPSSGQLLWIGGLGAMAALEFIEWPVALVAAAATFVAEQQAKSIARTGSATS